MSSFTNFAIDVASVNRQGVGTSIAGVLIDPQTMKPMIADEQAAEHSMQVGSPTDQVVILLARGELAKAGELIAESRFVDPTNVHLRLLDTELTRMQGDFDRAINRLRKLSGLELDVLFLQLMLRHHEGGKEMAEYAAKHASEGYVRNLAQKIVDSQQAESDLMRQLLAQRGAKPLPVS